MDAMRGDQKGSNGDFRKLRMFGKTLTESWRGKKKVGAGIGATPTWGYCVCCYLDRRRITEKVSAFAEINITKYPKVNRTQGLAFLLNKKTLRLRRRVGE